MLVALVATAFAAAPPPIINGEAADASLYPMTGGLLFSGYIDMGRYGAMQYDALLCSSTLIAPDVLLVAAHCLDPETLTQGYGTVENTEFRWSRQADLTEWDGSQTLTAWPDDAVQAWDWVFNPDFDVFSMGAGLGENSDVGLVFLDTPVLDVDPAVLITEAEAEQVVEGADVAIVGWGQQNAKAQPDPGTFAEKMWGMSTLGEVGATEMLVGPTRDSVRKCHGDSGGPTFMDVTTDSPEVMRQIGITSHAYDGSDCKSVGGVDTRVSAYLEWIDSEMRARCEDGTRVWCDVPGILPPPSGEDTGTPDDTGSGDTGSGDDTAAADDSGGGGNGNGDGNGDTAGETPTGGCGCNDAPSPVTAALALAPLLLLSKRRRG